MELRLFAIEIIDNEVRLSFDSIQNIEDLDKWKELLGKNIDFEEM